MQAIEGLNPQHLATIIEIHEPAIPQSPRCPWQVWLGLLTVSLVTEPLRI